MAVVSGPCGAHAALAGPAQSPRLQSRHPCVFASRVVGPTFAEKVHGEEP
jgi:hypothetical protein